MFPSSVHYLQDIPIRNQNQGLYPSKPWVRFPVHNGSDDISGVLEILNDFHRLISALTISLL